MDPWFYFGGFIHFARYQRLVAYAAPWPGYALERFMWILPGALLVRAFSPVYGLLALHVLFYWLSLSCMYFLVRTFTERRTALLTACLLGCHPFFIGANGWAYLDSASIAYFLLTAAFIVKATSSRSPRSWLLLAGASWVSLVFTYVLWLSLTPCFIYFYYVTCDKDAVISFKALRERLVPFLTFFLLGGAGLTGCLQIIHVAIYGLGTGFFFRNNIAKSFVVVSRNIDPVSSGNFQWIWSAGWIVFPTLACLASVGLLVQNGRGVIKLSSAAKGSIYVYLYVLAMTVAMTVHAGFRLLEFDYYATILIPSLFLAMGVTIFRVPESWSDAWFYALLAACCAVCVLPLLRPNLYLLARIHGLAFTYTIGTLMMAACILFPRRRFSWVTLMCAFPVVSFALVPVQPGAAWVTGYDGIGLTRRVASALAAIDRRLPRDAYPAYWIDDYHSRYSAEYRAIMCATMSHNFSMKHYPDVDADRTYSPGTFLILITEHKYPFDAANEKMTNAGMPLSLYGQDLVSGGGHSYWLTYVRVMDRLSGAPTSRIAPPPQTVSVGADGWPETLRLGSQTSDDFSLVGPVTRQLFRSDMDSNSGWEINRYGGSGGLTIQPDCLSVGDSCGLYTSGDPRDHLASIFVELPSAKLASVFFSIWVKPAQETSNFRIIVQDDGYNLVAQGRQLATRDDGWRLYGDWLNVAEEKKLRLVFTESGGSSVLLDKVELLGFETELP